MPCRWLDTAFLLNLQFPTRDMLGIQALSLVLLQPPILNNDGQHCGKQPVKD